MQIQKKKKSSCLYFTTLLRKDTLRAPSAYMRKLTMVYDVKLAMKKRREHGLETWILFIDLVKVFDRVPRELMWKIVLKCGVPTKLVQLLMSLHANVNITFTVNDVTHTIDCIIGVKHIWVSPPPFGKNLASPPLANFPKMASPPSSQGG